MLFLPEVESFFSSATLLGLTVMSVASFAALDLARRAQSAHATVALCWLSAAGVVFATGLVAANVIAMSAVNLPFDLGYIPGRVIAAWSMAILFTMVALGWVGAQSASIGRIATGAAGWALGVVCCQVVAMESIGWQPGLHWKYGLLVLALFPTVVIATGSIRVFFDSVTPLPSSTGLLKHGFKLLAALAMGAGVVAGQATVVDAAQLAEQTASVSSLPASTLLGIATLVAVALLTMVLVSTLLESGKRTSPPSARSKKEDRSSTDSLTDLPNRSAFENALARAVARADARGAKVAVLAIDLDGFKSVNQSFGHDNGDKMLREIAARLRVMIKSDDVVARLGADEFLLLVEGNPDADGIATLASAILDVVCKPCTVGQGEASASCSIGIAMYPEHGALTALVTHAETALRSAKRAGGETFCFFETRMQNGTRENVDLLRDLRRAHANQEFELVYQPKVGAVSGELCGAEALIRWRHPKRGVISPTIFIPLAERFSLIGAIGEWVIEEACRQSRIWLDAGLRLRVSVNLSLHQVRRPDLPERVEAALKRHGVDAELLICEITESVAMEDPEGTMVAFKRLASIGVHLSIDDFGTGYSSLAYLRKLPASELKIDRSFVLDLEASADARAVVHAVIRLAQALGLRVVAEGVETAGQRDVLKSLGCDELQGFLFAKPMSAKALAVWAIEDWRPVPPPQRQGLRARLPLRVAAAATPVDIRRGFGH